MVWHNALLDLMEAERVVFIGYSLPLADFDLRYLLKKGIQKHTEIEVVLRDDDTFEYVKSNYKSFFGSQIKDENFSKEGSCEFLSKEFNFRFDEHDCV